MLKLGIDFGTCYSSAALLLEDIPTPIPAPLTPGYALPSSVFITEGGDILVGQAAENKRQKKPQRYRREFKRDLGSPDPYTLGNVSMLPEELIAEVLKKMKCEAEKVAQARGEKSLRDVLLTVPATYSSYKRNLMQEAGEKAGFKHIELLEEPVAAAIYYSRHSQINDGDIILVYDLGGGTFDATLMQKQGDKYQFLGMPKGLANCGGTDFDRLIYQELKHKCSAALRQQLEPKEAWLARAIVGDMCRDLKHQLSEQSEASIYIPMGLGQVEPFELTREAFNDMISPLIEETLDCCEQLVRSAAQDWQQVKQMLLVGGSSRIPYVKAAIERRFNISPFLVDKPELAVCLGAAISDNIPKPEPVPSQKEIIETHINSGDNLYQQGKLEEAITKYKQAIQLNANNTVACHKLEIAEQSLRDKQEAEIQRQRQQETKRQSQLKIKKEHQSSENEIQQASQKRQSELKAQEKNSRLSYNANLYFRDLIPYLQSQGFSFYPDVDFKEYELVCLALLNKEKVSFGYLLNDSWNYKIIFFISYFDKLICIDHWKTFSNFCINCANKYELNSISNLGNNCSLLCPIIVTDKVDIYLIDKVSKQKTSFLDMPKKKLMLPGIYELNNRQVIFPKNDNTFLGSFDKIFNHWRKYISQMLTH
ncbi:Heat shock protein 70 [Gloeothece citriformis PCC 7424]|uniref:Heat shock protein 70 n=1 Tax=Gloeothece citriformis (strain PCC 7424) TaxID=65393 RepID=B7KJ05_GLOC7|nr:Hsp70 family protein [Gloeothece citriformis]ACK70841.1 Heat shock protein 70 [Gloeothece citriformis PCC 7424]